MAGLCWMVVVLVFSLSAGHSEAMNKNDVQKIVQYILGRYSIVNKHFSLAVNIPVNQDLTKLPELFNDDDAATVRNTVQSGNVYRGINVVEALPRSYTAANGYQYTDHAEARVLDNIQPLAHCSAGNSLVFYSYLSPCGTKCTNPNNYNNILKKIDNIRKDKWADSAFVFSTVFDGYKDQNGNYVYFTVDEIRNTLKNLGTTKFRRDNIFRCFRGKNNIISCINCFKNGALSDDCVFN
ncbi:uncharacterized protein LOC117962216 isoform X2 [Etheostoma cragini]|nr:uncharacterized protein LOC117962216 isoform X2 [Etheostoma cragini]